MTDKQDITPTLEDHLAAKPFLNRYILDSPYSDGAGELAKAFAIHAAQAREEGARMMLEAAANLCNERGAFEQEAYGLVRATQNYFRARDCIRRLDPAEIVKGKS